MPTLELVHLEEFEHFLPVCPQLFTKGFPVELNFIQKFDLLIRKFAKAPLFALRG